MRNVYVFRADGNPKIGSGHIMRSLSLAAAFQRQSRESIFITADTYFRSHIQGQGFRCIVLDGKYDCLEQELPALLPVISECSPNGLILDSYFVTPSYMTALRNAAPLLYMDDLNLFDYPADVVVNYGLYAEKMEYPPGKIYLLGPQYAPLREEFRGMKRRMPARNVKQVLLSTGGGDPEHVALACVRYLREHRKSDIVLHVILGAMNQDAAEIERMARELPQVVPHKSVKDMRALMLQCDAAIAAAGTTLFELCACGLPTVTYALADNQLGGAAVFEKAGLMLHAGDIRGKSDFAAALFARLDELAADWPLRQSMAERMQKLVDGNGAPRLAKQIQVLFGRV